MPIYIFKIQLDLFSHSADEKKMQLENEQHHETFWSYFKLLQIHNFQIESRCMEQMFILFICNAAQKDKTKTHTHTQKPVIVITMNTNKMKRNTRTICIHFVFPLL